MTAFVCAEPPEVGPKFMAASRLALQVSRQWTDREQLRVRFLSGTPELHHYVAQAVDGPHGWNACSAMQFVFSDEKDSEIRISFDSGSSWSQVGTDALWVPVKQATMNLAIRLEDAGAHIDRPIHHEFGHALGFIHGHQNPYLGPLDEPAVYAWYRSRGYPEWWTKANVLERLPLDDVSAIGGAIPSVMNYHIPRDLWLDGKAPEPSDYPTYWDAYAAETWYGAPPERYTSILFPIAGRG